MIKAVATYTVLLMLAFADSAHAKGLYVGGEGIVGCGEYLQDRRDNKETQAYVYATWVRGYISGFNMATSGTPAPTFPGPDTILAYLDKHCRDNPLDSLVKGAATLVEELGATSK